MKAACPRCGSKNRPEARFCARCGLSLAPEAFEPGRIRDPNALVPPDGFERVGDAADLHFRWESAWGGKRLIDTENIGVLVFNAGYPLRDVTLRVRGQDDSGRRVFEVEQTAAELPRGERVMVEVASYDIATPPSRLSVSLVSAEFSPVE